MIQRLTIIGVGLLGGSVGLAVKSRLSDCRVIGYGTSPGDTALAMGAVDRWAADIKSAVAGADVVVIAAPVLTIPHCLAEIGPHVKPGAIVTDVGSAKTAIVAAGEAAIRSPAAFVGSHPMAGGSRAGVAMARADLFDGAACVLTPTAATDPAALKKVSDFWQALGGRIVVQSPPEHDRVVALVSHLPHALAAALMAVQEDASLAIRGKGFIDTSRVAAGDPGLWRDIFAANRGNVISAVDALAAQLLTFRDLLETQDDEAVLEWLNVQATRRNKVD